MPVRGYADGPFGQIHYQDTRAEGVPLMLCHQAPMTSRQYDNVYPVFAQRGIRAIGIDYPGFGMSDPSEHIPSVADYAKCVLAVMDHMSIEVADICGHHTGAMVANEMALLFPERVRNIIMHGPCPMSQEERDQWHEYTRINEKEFEHKTDGSHLAEWFQRRWQWAEEGTDPALVTRYVVETMMGYGPFWYGHNAAFNYDHEANLKKLKHRSLILTNTGDMIFELAELAHKLRPDFDYVVMEGGGVDIVDQQPEEWVDAIMRFIATG